MITGWHEINDATTAEQYPQLYINNILDDAYPVYWNKNGDSEIGFFNGASLWYNFTLNNTVINNGVPTAVTQEYD